MKDMNRRGRKGSETPTETSDFVFTYADSDTLAVEIAEWYTYSEEAEFLWNANSFKNIFFAQKHGNTRWSELSMHAKKTHIVRLLDQTDNHDKKTRDEVARAILYLLQGVFKECETIADYNKAMVENVILLYDCDGFNIFTDMLLFEINNLSSSFQYDQKYAPCISDNGDLRVILSILYTMIEVIRCFEDEVKTGRMGVEFDETTLRKMNEIRSNLVAELNQPLVKCNELFAAYLMQLVNKFCNQNIIVLPVKKIVLLLWKVLLLTLGGVEDAFGAKNAARHQFNLAQIIELPAQILNSMTPATPPPNPADIVNELQFTNPNASYKRKKNGLTKQTRGVDDGADLNLTNGISNANGKLTQFGISSSSNDATDASSTAAVSSTQSTEAESAISSTETDTTTANDGTDTEKASPTQANAESEHDANDQPTETTDCVPLDESESKDEIKNMSAAAAAAFDPTESLNELSLESSSAASNDVLQANLSIKERTFEIDEEAGSDAGAIIDDDDYDGDADNDDDNLFDVKPTVSTETNEARADYFAGDEVDVAFLSTAEAPVSGHDSDQAQEKREPLDYETKYQQADSVHEPAQTGTRGAIDIESTGSSATDKTASGISGTPYPTSASPPERIDTPGSSLESNGAASVGSKQADASLEASKLLSAVNRATYLKLQVHNHKSLPWKPKVRQCELELFLDLERKKFLGYGDLTNDLDTLIGLPHPIHESVKILKQHLYRPLGDEQIKLEESFYKHPMSTREPVNQHKKSEEPNEGSAASESAPSELLYACLLSNLPQYLICLLKLLLASVPQTKPKGESLQIMSDLFPEDLSGSRFLTIKLGIDSNRHKEIIIKAISAILLLMLKHFKANHIYQFEFMCQHLLFANCLPLILKFFNLNLVSFIQSKNNFAQLDFPFCVIGEQPELDASDLENGDASVFRWRNVFSSINMLRILNKITKYKRSRIMMLVIFKSVQIFKKVLRVKQAMLQYYALKLIKMQTRNMGRNWRKSNMSTMSAIYQKVRHRLNDDWAFGNELEAQAWDFQSEESLLKAKIDRFNQRRYKQQQQPQHQQDETASATSLECVAIDESNTPGEESIFSALANSEIKLPEGFDENYEQWLEEEVFSNKIDWDFLLTTPRNQSCTILF